MLKRMEYAAIVCDECGEEGPARKAGVFRDLETAARDAAKIEGFRFFSNRVLCPECDNEETNQEDCDPDAWSGGFAENH